MAPPAFALHAQAALLRQHARGAHRAITVCRRPFQTARPRRHARPQPARARLLPFRSPLLREPRLLSPPGLTDMLKFGPSPRPAQGGLLASRGAARRPAVPTLRRCTARGVPPWHSKSDDSHRAEARRHQSRSVLRSSSTPEPSGPLLPVDRCVRSAVSTSCHASKTQMIRPQVPLRQPCYDFSFLQTGRLAELPAAQGAAVRTARQSVQVGRSDGRCVQKTGTQSACGDHARLLDIPRSRGTIPTPGPYHGGSSRVAALLDAATPCGRQCSTRAAQSVEGHHRPASATALVRLVAGAPAADCGGGLAR